MRKLCPKPNPKKVRQLAAAGVVLGVALGMFPLATSGQTHVWSQRFGGTDFDEGHDITVDAAGNVIVAGWFSGTADLGGGPMASAGLRDIFVAKYDAAGNHIWSRGFGDIGYDEAWAVAVDGGGAVLVTGMFNGTIDAGGGNLRSAGRDDIFVAKYDPTGNHVWSRRFGDTEEDGGWDIAVDRWGNVLLTGAMEGTVDFGGGPLTGAGFADIFVAKYDPAGIHIWSARYGDTETDIGGGVAADGAGNVLVTGHFGGRVDFGGGTLSSEGSGDIFIAKYTPEGSHIWSYRYGDTSYDAGNDIAVDGMGNVVVTGGFGGTVNFGGGPLTSAGSGDIFVAKYDPSGSHMWSRHAGDVNGDAGFAITVDGAGDVLVTGFFQGTADLGGGPLISAGAWEIFVAIYNSAGIHVWSQRFGDTLFDAGHGIATDALGNVHITGYFRVAVNFGDGPLISAGSEDIFVAKLGRCQQPMLAPLGYRTVWYSFPLWEVQVELRDDGPGAATSVAAWMNDTSPWWLMIPDPDCFYGDIPDGGTSWGDPDSYMFDLTQWPGGSFIVFFDVTYADICGNQYLVTLDAEFTPSPTGIGDLPKDTFTLSQNHPNPFNPGTRIAFVLDQEAHVDLSIYDTAGRHVTTLVDRLMTAGTHAEEWDGRDSRGMSVSSGVYFYRLTAGGRTLTRKAVLLR
jgi:hypothetical protein